MTLHVRTELWPYSDSMINIESKDRHNLVLTCKVIEKWGSEVRFFSFFFPNRQKNRASEPNFSMTLHIGTML